MTFSELIIISCLIYIAVTLTVGVAILKWTQGYLIHFGKVFASLVGLFIEAIKEEDE